MSLNTKAFCAFLTYTFIFPLGISAGLYFTFAIPFMPAAITLILFSALFDQILTKSINAKRLADFTDKYSKLQYKKYMVELTCQSCNYTNVVELDLTKNTEFVCERCHRKNAIYTTFTTAIASPHEKL